MNRAGTCGTGLSYLQMRSITLRPLEVFALLYEITETVPFDLAVGDRTPQLYLAFTDADYLPIATARTAFDAYFLSDLQRVRSEHCDLMCRH